VHTRNNSVQNEALLQRIFTGSSVMETSPGPWAKLILGNYYRNGRLPSTTCCERMAVFRAGAFSSTEIEVSGKRIQGRPSHFLARVLRRRGAMFSILTGVDGTKAITCTKKLGQ